MIIRISLLCLLAAISWQGRAQETPNVKADSIKVVKDTTFVEAGSAVPIKSYANRYDPRKALLFAAVLPGAGQIYNKKYWKLPLVYGGLGLIINAVSYYQNAYVKYKNELYISLNGGTPPSNKSQTTLRAIVDEARRERDFFLVIGGLVYMLQMVDAHVDAHLKEFDLNPKLKLSVQPKVEYNSMTGRSSGISMTLKF